MVIELNTRSEYIRIVLVITKIINQHSYYIYKHCRLFILYINRISMLKDLCKSKTNGDKSFFYFHSYSVTAWV